LYEEINTVQWQDEGIVLSARAFQEKAYRLSLLTPHHGRRTGLIALSRSQQAHRQPGTLAQAVWRGRLATHLGRWTLEVHKVTGACLLKDPLRLQLLSRLCYVGDRVLPEAHPYPSLYQNLKSFIALLLEEPKIEKVLGSFFHLELLFLAELGFGLDLTHCTATGQKNDLIYVSPKTGRAVCAEAGERYKSRLLPLPAFLIDPDTAIRSEHLQQAARLTSYFFHKHLSLPPDPLISIAVNVYVYLLT
jgi:DNA repair protein RecO (recombination protein O)